MELDEASDTARAELEEFLEESRSMATVSEIELPIAPGPAPRTHNALEEEGPRWLLTGSQRCANCASKGYPWCFGYGGLRQCPECAREKVKCSLVEPSASCGGRRK